MDRGKDSSEDSQAGRDSWFQKTDLRSSGARRIKVGPDVKTTFIGNGKSRGTRALAGGLRHLQTVKGCDAS